MPLPRSSAVPSVDQRPHWLAMSISCSSSCAAVSQPVRRLASRRCTWRAAAPGSRDQAAMARERKSGATWASASITATTVAAHLRLRPGEHRALGPRTRARLPAADGDGVRCRLCGDARQLAGAVGRPVVKDQDVEAPLAAIGVVLRDQVGHHGGDHRRLVRGRNQHRDPRAVARRRRSVRSGIAHHPPAAPGQIGRRTAATGRSRPAAAVPPARR